MDTIITLLIIFSVLGKLFGKNKKKQARHTKKTGSLESLFENVAEFFQEETPAPAKPAPAKPAPEAVQYMEGSGSAPAFRSQLGDHSTEGRSRYGTAPVGSMTSVSTEGMDICDPTLGHDDHSTGCEVHEVMEPLDDMEYGAGSGLDMEWNSEGMVKAFIMSEVLTRPGQRLQRRG